MSTILRSLNSRHRIVSLRLLAPRGTYIRSIAHDLGQKIGCGAHLKTLGERSRDPSTSEAYRLERILEMEIADLAVGALIPLDQLRESTLTG